MKNSKLVLVAVVMLFSAVNVTAQKKKQAAPSRPGPLEMPKDAEIKVMPGDEQFENSLSKLEEFVTFKFDAQHKNADVYITENGKQKLMYKAKLDETGVDTKLKAGIDNRKIYSLDGKTLLFTYETEPSATSLIKMIYNTPEKKFTIFDFSKIYGSDEYTIGKTLTFKYFPVFLYYSTFNAPR
ncbi:hypothetical protein [Chryseobacterium luteum]|uniref:Uncharacterized protein n=1 Tax=Chryseobacterium luteum TaxID=421531 RepID=A0A085YY08_9FLAO|nr:hypothetical protein [Chryseobacterium luteum]KFE97071.1 hypothetical protein IX38_21650 [Chryseobacterium luteum]